MAEPAGESTLPAISVSTVARRMLRDRVIASGLIGPVEEVRVQPLIEGQPVEALMADVGDRVAEGQVLAKLSSSTLELQKSQFVAQLASARATIAQAEAQLVEATAASDEAARVNDRTAALRQQGTASQAAADQAQANATAAAARVTVAQQTLEAAKAQVNLVAAQIANVDLQLSRTEVKAPVAGEIAARNAVVGAIATATGQPMFVMIRDGALELRADVAEGDLVRLAAGQTAEINAVGASRVLYGQIRLVEPTIDSITRLGRARLSVDNPDMVRSGMFADAEIIVARRETLAVPVSAVGADKGSATVMVVTDGRVIRRAVTTGIRDGGWVEITEGLAAGDTIVTKAGSFVRDGDRINPVPVN
ncbi:MAG: efflux RND transporter periplasmic adaptor subunit [Paracoccaceae bacterium]